MEIEKSEELTQEAIDAEKKQKSRNRFFGLLVIINLALLAIFIYEIVVLALNSGS